MKKPTVVIAASVSPQPWRNGGGQTRELLLWPEEANAWRLRISLASVTRSGPFSRYPGVQRWFTVVEGNGVALLVAGKEYRLNAASAPLQFCGDTPVQCDLLDGPTSDLNLMVCGGVGRMQHAVAGEPWSCELSRCGLFTRVRGTVTDEDGAVYDLPPHALFWVDSASGASFCFDSAGTEQGPAGIWLGFDADAPRANGTQR
jgi:environmental stress-induced protein Ves